MSQLRNDLYKRIIERHFQWHRDAADLYQMAGLRASQLRQDVFTVLMMEIVGFCIEFGVKPKEVAEALRSAIAHLKEQEAEE